MTYLSEYCTILPFLDHEIQLFPLTYDSDLLKARITRGRSLTGYFATLQTRKSPSEVCVASMSDLCFEDDACQASAAMGEGPLEVVRVCRIVKDGWSVAINIEPFWYLGSFISIMKRSNPPGYHLTRCRMSYNPKPVPGR